MNTRKEEIQNFVSIFVHDIVNEIVTVVQEREHDSKHLPTYRQHRLIPLIKQVPNAQLPIIACREPSDHFSVAQLKVLKQEKNDSCGYYALFNIITAVSALHLPIHERSKDGVNNEDVIKYLERIHNRTRFWITYSALLKKLRAKAIEEGDKSYPWQLKYIDCGILERPHMDYLLKEGGLREVCGGLDFDLVILPDFSLTHMKNNVLPIQRLQHLHEVFSNIKARSNSITAFMLGSVCHWISVVCNKVDGHLEIILFDSRNHNLFDSTEEEFEGIITSYEKEDKKPVNPYMRDAYLLSLKEPKLMVNLFHDCIVGGENIMSLLLGLNLEAFLDSFDTHVMTRSNILQNSELRESDVVVSLPALVMWLESFWPPPVIRQNIINMLVSLGVRQNKQLISSQLQMRFSRWVDTLLKSIDFHSSGIDSIERFAMCVSWFSTTFPK